VRTSAEEMDSWDRDRIEEALIRETQLDDGTAKEIAAEVEEQLSSAKIKMVTAPLIRELVNAKLIERGLEAERLQAHPFGRAALRRGSDDPLPNKENANVPHGPEATNLTLAENIKKEYALINVFSHRGGRRPHAR
jgi:anaerobic ribonucleoside-triphosphate reductase